MKSRGLHGNLVVLLAAIFLIACAEELWSRFIPNYLRALGGSVFALAAYGTLKDFLDAIYQFPGGALTARLGYKKALIAFNVIAICGYMCFGLAQRWWVLLVALPLVMAWQSFSLPATFSLIGDALPKGKRSMAFAYQSIIRRIPIVLAPVAGGVLITAYGPLSGTRLAILLGIAIAATALAVQAARYSDAGTAVLSFRQILGDVARLHPRLKRLLLSDIVVRFGQGTAEIYVVVYVVHVLGMSAAAFGVFVGLAMATSLLVYIPVARIADSRGRELWVTLTYGFFAAFPLVLGAASALWAVVLAFVLMGLREIGEPPRKAMIVDLAREGRRSVDVGAYYLVRGLAVFPASLFGGWLWRITPQSTFFGAAAIAACGLIVFQIAVARQIPVVLLRIFCLCGLLFAIVSPTPAFGASKSFCSVMDSSLWKMTTSNARKFPGRFIRHDESIQSEPGQAWGVYWCNEPLPANFILRIEWLRHEDDDNSGVFIRFPNPFTQNEPNTALVAARGFEIQIDELGSPDGAPYHRTGAIYGQLGQRFSLRPARPVGQWNVFEIEAKGQHYRVRLNGAVVSEFINHDSNRAKPTIPGAPSYFGVQAERGHVEFRRVGIRKL